MDSFELSQWEIYINKLQEEIKALKEENEILKNQNKDLLLSLESLKSE